MDFLCIVSSLTMYREDCNAVEPTECYSNDAVCQGYYEQVILDHSRTGKQTALCELEMGCGKWTSVLG